MAKNDTKVLDKKGECPDCGCKVFFVRNDNFYVSMSRWKNYIKCTRCSSQFAFTPPYSSRIDTEYDNASYKGLIYLAEIIEDFKKEKKLERKDKLKQIVSMVSFIFSELKRKFI